MPEANQWHQVSLVLDVPKSGLGTITGYLDGSSCERPGRIRGRPSGRNRESEPSTPARHFTIRGDSIENPSELHRGTIDEVRITIQRRTRHKFETLTPANLQDDLTVHWAADDGAGTILSRHVSRRPRQFGSTGSGAHMLQGQNGGGLLFDGTGYIDVNNSPDINLDEVQQRTISLNFKADALTAADKFFTSKGFNLDSTSTWRMASWSLGAIATPAAVGRVLPDLQYSSRPMASSHFGTPIDRGPTWLVYGLS